MTEFSALPGVLADWRDAARMRRLNACDVLPDGSYVLCVLRQGLRAIDNPALDAAIRLGNSLCRPVLVFSAIATGAPYASLRLSLFRLAALADLETGCAARGVRCVTFIGKSSREAETALLGKAAAIVLDTFPTSPARAHLSRVTGHASCAVFGADCTCFVPPDALSPDIKSRSRFLKQHVPERARWMGIEDETVQVGAYGGALPFVPADLRAEGLRETLIAYGVDGSVPETHAFVPGQAGVENALRRLASETLPVYASRRNDATCPEGASRLSPYLHFGMIGPRTLMDHVARADAGPKHKEKFADEVLGWREWFHYQARGMDAPEHWERIPHWARESLLAHADDARPEQETFASLLGGTTKDETWNACQRQFLAEGWMHNNLRMYWAKRLIGLTPDPRTAWATACFLNDRLSLDGRDPATYGNIAAMFSGQPDATDAPVYGCVAQRGDGSTRHRPGGDAWLSQAARRTVPDTDLRPLPAEAYGVTSDPVDRAITA